MKIFIGNNENMLCLITDPETKTVLSSVDYD